MRKNLKTINSSHPLDGYVGIAYLRVSSKKQETEGSGLDSQQARCIDELKKIKVPYHKSFSDSYTGGGDFMNRPAMRDLIGYIDEHPHKKFVVVFDDLKRFARDTEFHLKLRAAFRVRGVILKCPNYNFDDSPEGNFAETVLAAGNELERRTNQRQVVQKMKARLELGYWSFGSKRGYIIKKDPIHGKLSTPYKKDAKALATALEGFANGTYARKIDACNFLIENGFWKNKTPEKYVQLLDRILRDVFYAGYIEYPKWEVQRRKGHHRALISLETYELNQIRLNPQKTTLKARIDVSSDFPMRGLIRCASCEKHISAAWSKGNGGRIGYYFCQNKICNLYRKSIPKKLPETGFEALLTESILKPDVEKYLYTVFDKVWKEEIDLFNKLQIDKLKKKNELQERIQRLTELIIKTTSEKVSKAYEEQIEKTTEELEYITKTYIEKVNDDTPYRTALEKSITLLKSPYKIWNNSTVSEKHQLFFFLFEEKLKYNRIEGYRTSNIPTIARLFERFVTTNHNEVDMVNNISNQLKDYLSRFWVYYQTSSHLQNILQN